MQFGSLSCHEYSFNSVQRKDDRDIVIENSRGDVVGGLLGPWSSNRIPNSGCLFSFSVHNYVSTYIVRSALVFNEKRCNRKVESKRSTPSGSPVAETNVPYIRVQIETNIHCGHQSIWSEVHLYE